MTASWQSEQPQTRSCEIMKQSAQIIQRQPWMAHPTLPLMLVLVPQGQQAVAETSSSPWMAAVAREAAAFVAAAQEAVMTSPWVVQEVQK